MRHFSSHMVMALWAVLACMAGTAGAESVDPPTAPAPSGSSSTLTPQVADNDRVDELPERAQGIHVDEKIGATVPLELGFRDSTGRSVTLRDYLDGNLPVILTFNYSTCPMLCSAQLGGLVEGMGKIPFTAGAQYQIVTVAIDPLETPDTARETKKRYLASFSSDEQATIASGWHFLTGDESATRALADSVGFNYRYIEEIKEFSHAATLIFLSPKGVVTSYYHGIHYEPETFGRSIFSAGMGEHGVSVGFLLACFRPSHDQGHAKTGESVMRYGALGFVVLLLIAFGTWQMMRTRGARQE
jgi:protein SCO1